MARKPINRLRNVRPDPADFRDRIYAPPVSAAPPAMLLPRIALPVLDQGETAACTGFALATVIHHLLHRASRPADAPVSPWMLYSMARRYDEFPGSADRGSSLRGALRGWHRHGACSAAMWPSDPMPPASLERSRDWWVMRFVARSALTTASIRDRFPTCTLRLPRLACCSPA